MKLFKLFICVTLSLMGLFLSACSPTKFVPEGQYLLDKVDFVTETDALSNSDLKLYLRQEPNFKVFGLYKLYLSFYNMSGRDSTKWRNKQLRSIGEPPVIYDGYMTSRSEQEIEKYVRSKGFCNAEVKAWTEFNNKKAKVTYYIKENEPYRLRNITYNFASDSEIDSLYTASDQKSSLLKKGMLFDIDQLDEERKRIDKLLKRRGYYYFNKDYLTYTADSSLKSHEVDVTLSLKPYLKSLPDGTMEEVHHKRYTVRDVNMLVLKDSKSTYSPYFHYDTLRYKPNLNIISDGKPILRPKVLDEELCIYPHLPYSSFFVDRTYAKLNALGAVRSTNIEFVALADSSSQLDCFVLISPSKAQSFSLDLEGTNSWGDLGFAVTGGYTHKNIFRGSETFNLKGRYEQEAYSGITNFLSDYTKDIGAEMSINFPRFMFPFTTRAFRQRINASTEFKLSYNYQTRPNTYEKYSSTIGVRYIWNMRRFYRYCFDIIDLNYVNINTHPDFDSLYSAPKYSVLRDSYSDHFIFSSGFSLVFDDKTSQRRRDKTYYKIAVESAGNLLQGICTLADRKPNENGQLEFAGLPFSQYVKGEAHFARSKYIDRKNILVYHIGCGLAYPYGNAEIVPFEKRFFGGGANSVRGWSVRTLGPGSYSSENKDDFVKQSGDVKLDANIEHRTKLFWKIEMAAFFDAGNVWTIRQYESQPKGAFSFNSFYKEIAMAYGAGLRFDFTFFLLRFDMGVKAFDPSRSSADRWRFKGLNWSDDFAFHFAIGYPF
ncbi:MAG: BamA/TamA family outer membrane protein [Paludibacteraceae bacterium]|nr:BamA/TamA family outer membrane protein [Paludibacteraceae bacterium]